MSNSRDIRRGNIGFPEALTLLFIGLELGGVIDWSWWWVLSPVWVAALGLVAVSLVESHMK